MSFDDALILTGPTASGKTALALELAERLDVEIIAMDSMTLYRGMDIGTAKPSPEERAQVPHHLIDVLDPWESGSVAWWLGEADRICQEIRSRGRTPLFVGGTPLYLKALLCGLFDSPPADEALRDRLIADAERDGLEALHARLAAIDPASGQRLHPNDIRRVVRALEVWELTGRTMSDWQQEWSRDPSLDEDSPRAIALELPREQLYEQINTRVLAMIENGWLDEVRRLQELPHPMSREASQAVGYSELSDYLNGEMNLETAIDQIQTRSRQFAKRQLTWFRGMAGVEFLRAELTFAVWQSRINR